MALPIRTWTVDANNQFTDDLDQPLQYQEAMMALKNVFLAAGWTVQASSNGTIATDDPVPSSNPVDNWNSTADINLDRQPPTGTGSWIVLRSPVGWASTQIDALLKCDIFDVVNPQQAPIQFAPFLYNPDGLVGTLPTVVSGSETTDPGAVNAAIIPWTTETVGRWTSWYTSKGDIMFGVKQEGRKYWQFMMFLSGNTTVADGGQGAHRWMYGTTGNASTDALVNPYTSSIHWRAANSDGTIATQITLRSELELLSSWTDGYDSKGEIRIAELHSFSAAAAQGRSFGKLFGGDVSVGITNTPFGTLIDSESGQTLRRVCMSSFFFFFPEADLPVR